MRRSKSGPSVVRVPPPPWRRPSPSSIGGIWSADLWNPKYASHVYKVTVAIDMLGNIIWICPFAAGTSADLGWVWTFLYPR